MLFLHYQGSQAIFLLLTSLLILERVFALLGLFSSFLITLPSLFSFIPRIITKI